MLRPGMTFSGKLVLFVFKSGKALIWDMYSGDVFTIDNIVYLYNEKCIIYYTDFLNSFPPGRLDNIVSKCQYNGEKYYISGIDEIFKMKYIDIIKIISFQPLIVELTNKGYEYISTNYKKINRHLSRNTFLNKAIIDELGNGFVVLKFKESSIIDKFKFLENSEINEIQQIDNNFKFFENNVDKLLNKYDGDDPIAFEYKSNEKYKIILNIRVSCKGEMLPLPLGTELFEPALRVSEMCNRVPHTPYYSQLGWDVIFSGPPIVEWKIKFGNNFKRIALPIQLIESVPPTIRGTGIGGSVWPVGQA